MTRIVAIHGFLGRPDDWAPLSEALHRFSPEVDFQAVNLFAEVPSTRQKRIDDWAKDFNQSQKSRHVERNILMGYSLGGRLALEAAIEKPGLWDEVVLISAHPGLMGEEERQRRENSDRDWAEKFIHLPWQEVVRLWNGQPVFIGSREPDRLEAQFDRQALAQTMVNWSLAHQDFKGEGLVNLKPKLHWYAGEKDKKYVDLFQHLRADGFIEDVHTIKGASHRVIFDKPDDLARQLVHNLNL